jgi:hypothetical protein
MIEFITILRIAYLVPEPMRVESWSVTHDHYHPQRRKEDARNKIDHVRLEAISTRIIRDKFAFQFQDLL